MLFVFDLSLLVLGISKAPVHHVVCTGYPLRIAFDERLWRSFYLNTSHYNLPTPWV